MVSFCAGLSTGNQGDTCQRCGAPYKVSEFLQSLPGFTLTIAPAGLEFQTFRGGPCRGQSACALNWSLPHCSWQRLERLCCVRDADNDIKVIASQLRLSVAIRPLSPEQSNVTSRAGRVSVRRVLLETAATFVRPLCQPTGRPRTTTVSGSSFWDRCEFAGEGRVNP